MTEDAVEEKWADVFKAMGDKTRLSILQRLFDGECCVTDLAKSLQMDTPRVSFHLTRLKYAGLVVDERRGQRVAYKLNPAISGSTKGATEFRIGECRVTFSSNGR